MEVVYSAKRQISPIIFGIDFDGTVATMAYPKIGKEIPGSVRVLKRLTDARHKLILFTIRDNKELADAAKWFQDRNIELFGINENSEQRT